MDEATYRGRDFGLKRAAAILAVLGAGVGLYQYIDNAHREAKKPFWERTISAYFDVTNAAAILSASDDASRRREAAADFWRLYWGQLAIVEDRPVQDAKERFGECLKRECARDQLQQLSLALAHACHGSLAKYWSIHWRN